MPNAQCLCLESPEGLQHCSKLFLGIDETHGRYGEVELQTCSNCQQVWLHYFVTYEGFSNSGRWFRGMITPAGAAAVTPETAPEFLSRLEWYYAGGSYFNGMVTKRSGMPKVDL